MKPLPTCQHCGQPVNYPAGEYLPPKLQRIFNLIMGAGRSGFSSEALQVRVYSEQSEMARRKLKANIYELRSYLASTSFRITYRGPRPGVYVLETES